MMLQFGASRRNGLEFNQKEDLKSEALIYLAGTLLHLH